MIYGCNKPKTVLICGDHVCVNKAEAEQYFEDNLILEVKVIEKKESKEINLVELNLQSDSNNKRQISIFNKQKTNKKLKELSNLEIKKKKAELKKRKKFKNKKIKQTKEINQAKLNKKKEKRISIDNTKKKIKIVNKNENKITDICTILEKCSIDEISKYLVSQGSKKKFPDITTRENN